MVKNRISLIVILGICILSNPVMADEVQLKDGQIIKGTITGMNQDSVTISINQADGTSLERSVPISQVAFFSSRNSTPQVWNDQDIVIGRRSQSEIDYGKVVNVMAANIFLLSEGKGLVQLIGVGMEKELDPGSGGNTFSGRAKQLVTRLLSLENNDLRLEYDTVRRDKNGKLLAYAYVGRAEGSKMLNERLIELGYARYIPDENNLKYDELLRNAESRAKESRAGFWEYDGLSDAKFYSALSGSPISGQIDPYSGLPYNPNAIPTPQAINRPLSEKVDLTPELLAAPVPAPRPSKPAGIPTESTPSISMIPATNLAAGNTTASTATTVVSPSLNPSSVASNDETVKKLLEQNEQMMKMMQQKDEMLQKLLEEILKKNSTTEGKTEP